MRYHPLVSVIIPVYNREKTIVRALRSVLNQTYANYEIIVVNDGSTDGSLSLIRSFVDDRITVISLSENHGASFARNIGMTEAKGEYIAFQDSDDEWLADKLEIQVDYMFNNGLYAVFCPYNQFFYGYKSLIPDQIFYQYEEIEKSILKILSRNNIIGTPSLVISKEIIEKVGVFDTQLFRLEDYDYVIRIAKKFKIGFIGRPLLNAFVQENSLTVNAHEEEAILQLLKKHSDFLDSEYFAKYLCSIGFFDKGGKVDCSKVECFNNLTSYDCSSNVIDYYSTECNRKIKILNTQFNCFANNPNANEFVIYGAGLKGCKALYELRKKGKEPVAFVVSDCVENCQLNGVPVCSIDDIENKELLFIIAAGSKNTEDIAFNLVSKGFFKFIVFEA